MKLIVGLGNLGEKYKYNRHNVGFMVVDGLVEEFRVRRYGLQHEWRKSSKGNLQYIWFDTKDGRIELIKPLSFMNESGLSVAYAYKKHSLSPNYLYVIHDDLDINLGDYKSQKGKGPKVHNGLLSIYKSLGNKDFWHVRIGIENRQKMENGKWKMENRVSGEDYVLHNFTAEERTILDKVIDDICKKLVTF